MPQVVTIGAVTVDITMPIEDEDLRRYDIEPGSSTQVHNNYIEEARARLREDRGELPSPLSGGSTANSTDVMARSALDCAFVGVGGDDSFGRHFRDDCKRAGMELLYPLQEKLLTGYNFCFFNDAGQNTIVWTPGANSHISPHVVDEAAIRSAELIVIDGYTFGFGQDGPATVQHAAALSRQHTIPYVLTLASTQMVETYRDFYQALTPDAELVVGSLAQAAALAGLPPDTDLEKIVADLSSTCPNILITLGKAGVFAKIDQCEYTAESVRVQEKDTTGAGDAFLGAFIVARSRKHDIPTALHIGNLVAAEVIKVEGARFPYEMEVSDLVEEAIHKASEEV